MTTWSDTFDEGLGNPPDATIWTVDAGAIQCSGDGLARATTAAGTMRVTGVSKKPAAATQEVSALVLATGTGTNRSIVIWLRFEDPVSTPAKAGYGLGLEWTDATTRTLSIVKLNSITGAIETLATTTDITLLSEDSSDLSVLQLLRLTVSDESSDGGQSSGVLLRGYLNELDDGSPALEIIDRGRSLAGASTPIVRAAGTYAVTFGVPTDVWIESFRANDAYVLPAFGAYTSEHRTLAELRTEVQLIVERGTNTNLGATFWNQAINLSVSDVLDELGDSAVFLRKFATVNMSIDANDLVSMPHDVDRVLEIWDATTREGVHNWMVAHSTTEQVQVYIPEEPSGRDYLVYYVERWQPMESDTDTCAVPRRWDELVTVGAARRMADPDRDGRFQVSMDRRYARRMAMVKKAMNTILRQEKVSLSMKRPNVWRGSRLVAGWQQRGPF